MTALAVVYDYSDIVRTARARMAELEMTYEVLDRISGVQDGYSAKLLGPGQARRFGPVSFRNVMAALGLRLIIEDDFEALAKYQPFMAPRLRQPRGGAAVGLNGEKLIPIKG